MNKQLLENLGMTPKEVALYIKLLELGVSSANGLSKRANENRTTTYSLLQSMRKKGFVSYTLRNGVKYFSSTNPSLLISHHFDDAENLKGMIPELMAIANAYSQKPKITFYEGIEGIKQIGEILLEVPGSTRLSLMGADERDIHPEVQSYYEEDFINRRIRSGIRYKAIVTGKLPMGSNYKSTEEGQLRELRYIDPRKLPIKMHIDIFPKNKVALYSYDKKDQMGVVIEHEAFFSTMKTFFELAWAGCSKEIN
jgi:HTH-type transcriptional regulator, sugar sensing transcriptional regulator